jgi:hypothetical protein
MTKTRSDRGKAALPLHQSQAMIMLRGLGWGCIYLGMAGLLVAGLADKMELVVTAIVVIVNGLLIERLTREK